MPRTLWQTTDECEVGAGDTIDVTTNYYEVKEIDSVMVTWSAGVAPSTGEDLVVSLDSGLGAAYDNVLLTVDPEATGAHKIVWYPDEVLWLGRDDQVTVEYANTDDLAIGVVINLKPAAG